MKDDRTVRRTSHSRISIFNKTIESSRFMRGESVTWVDLESHTEEVETSTDDEAQGRLPIGVRPEPSSFIRREP